MSNSKHNATSTGVVLAALATLAIGLAAPLCVGTTMMSGCPMDADTAIPMADCHGIAKQAMDCCVVEPAQEPRVVLSLGQSSMALLTVAERPAIQDRQIQVSRAGAEMILRRQFNRSYLYSSLLL